jgi:IPT/TIG domain/Putative Ig domain/Glycosyl hydrolase catalytic core
MSLNSDLDAAAGNRCPLGVRLGPRLHRPVLCELFKVSLSLAAAILLGCTGTVSPSKTTVEPSSNAIQITTAALPSGSVQNNYAVSLTASGGTKPYSWSLISGVLPSGLTLDTVTGAITGAPKQEVSNAPLGFRVIDSSSPPLSQTANLLLTISPAALVVTTTALPNGEVGLAYAATLVATGGTPPYTWTLASGSLPLGLSSNGSEGTIAGTPTQTIVSAPLVFKVTDRSTPMLSQTVNLALTVSSPPLLITTASLPSGRVAVSYAASLNASGGTPPYSWSIPSGNLPPGLTLTPSTGIIAGQATLSGNFSFVVKVQDAKASSASSSTSVNVGSASGPTVSAISPKSGSTDGGTSVTVSGSNFRSGVIVQFGSHSSPSVKVVSSTQIQAITPPEAGGTVTVNVQNSDGQSAFAANAFTFTAPSAPSPGPSAASADVIVDAGQTVSETGIDDLTAARNIYSSASAPESDGGLYPDWSLILSEFAMKRMRNINGLGDCALDTRGNLTGCSRLNNDLANIKLKNLTPHVIVGQWSPSFIGGNPLQWSDDQWTKYDALSYAVVNYVTNQFGGTGFTEVLFEVENEMDTTTDPRDLWLTTTSNVPQGDPSRFTQFDTVYSHWANAVNLVAHQNPSKKIRIAGPATGFWTVYYGSGQLWHNQIIKKYAERDIRLDVVSLHIYGADATNLAKYAQSIRQTLNNNGNSQAEIWVTEWGASSSGDKYFGDINASHCGAAWGVYFLLQALKGTVTGGAFLEVRDNQGHDTAGANADIYGASWNHVENSVEYPKPITNAFTMVERMVGTRKSIAVNLTKPNLYALASASSNSASLIVANYNYLFDWTHKNYTDQTTVENVTVAFKNLSFSGLVTVDRYLIDDQTSNLDSWVSAGKTPPSVQSTQLQKVESFSASVTSGTLSLPVRQFGQSAVSLYIVHQ